MHQRTIGDAVAMCCSNPARIAGLAHVGSLAPGLRADMVLMDADLNVKQVLVAGIVAFTAE